MVITFVDVTAQKRVATALALEERRRVLEGTIGRWPGIAYVEDVASGRSLVVSAATAGILGYERAVLERATEAFWRALRSPKSRGGKRGAEIAGRRAEEVQLRRQDGVLIRYGEVTVVLARAEDGSATLVLHFFRRRREATKGR